MTTVIAGSLGNQENMQLAPGPLPYDWETLFAHWISKSWARFLVCESTPPAGNQQFQ